MSAENDLELFIRNDSKIYADLLRPLQKRLALAKKKGTYDRAAALRDFKTIAFAGASKYLREEGPRMKEVSVNAQNAAAKGLLEYFEIEHSLGNM